MTAGPDPLRPRDPRDLEHTIELARNLGLRYSLTHNPAFLDHAIRVLEPYAAGNAGAALQLAELWTDRAALSGSAADLDTAIDYATRAADGTSRSTRPGSTRPGLAESTLANLLRMRFEQRGDLGDLNEAIKRLTRLLDLDTSSWARAQDRNRLGLALKRRYELTRDLPDLRLAIQVLSEAADYAVEHEHALGSTLNNLGSAYGHLYTRTHEPHLLDKAIEHHRASVDSTLRGDAKRAVRLSNLAIVLRDRYKLRGDPADLQDTLDAARSAVRLTSKHDVERPRRLHIYASALFARYKAYGDESDLQLCIRLGESAVKAGSRYQAHRAQFLNGLAEHLLVSLKSRPDPNRFARALALFDEARTLPNSLIHHRGRAARGWAILAGTMDPAAGLEGAQVAFDLFAAIDWHGMQISDRADTLATWSGFPSHVAGWAVKLGRPADAVRLLEQGRGQLWAQIAETRAEVSPRSSAARQLGEKLSAVHADLNRLTVSGHTSTGPSIVPSAVRRGEDLGRLNAERRRIMAELGRLGVREQYLGPPELSDLKPALTGGPIVLVNVAPGRCDGLLLRDDLGNVHAEAVRLPALELDDITEKIRSYGVALAIALETRSQLLLDRRRGQRSRRTVRAGFDSALDELRSLLKWGWDSITGPVLQAVGHCTPVASGAPWSRVWWSPTGPLVTFPLHATGHHDDSGDSVIDRVASSEVVSLRHLAEAYTRSRKDSPPSLLAAAVASPRDGAAPLSAVPEEIAAVKRQAPVPTSVLADTAATRARVLRELTQHTWFHFAGHGTTTITDPTDAALLAFDQPITVADLATALQGDADLAFLSSCHGATPDLDHPDEALHLAAAFHIAGFRNIIATRHPVDDVIAQRVAAAFYRELRTDPDPGLALHHAIRAMRSELTKDRDRDDLTHPWAWIGYTHLGPAGLLATACA